MADPPDQTPGSMGKWETAVAIAVPMCGASLMVMFGCFRWQKRRKRLHQQRYRSDDSIEAPDHPILGGVSIRDMIEMTTSGSGSGWYT